MKKPLYITGLLLLAGFSATSAHAKPKVLIKNKNYKVFGSNIAEIEQSIHKNGIPAENGVTFAANTDYNLSWQFKLHESNNICSIESANVEVIITYTLPKLESNPDNITKNQWDKYYTSLKTHEDGHAKLGMQAAEEIEWAIANTMPPMHNCNELVQAANNLGENIANKYHNDNILYDSETNHGHNQGAFFLANSN